MSLVIQALRTCQIINTIRHHQKKSAIQQNYSQLECIYASLDCRGSNTSLFSGDIEEIEKQRLPLADDILTYTIGRPRISEPRY